MKRVRKPFGLRPFVGSVPERATEKSAVSACGEKCKLLVKGAIRGVCPQSGGDLSAKGCS